jgi:hypothetical protein
MLIISPMLRYMRVKESHHNWKSHAFYERLERSNKGMIHEHIFSCFRTNSIFIPGNLAFEG